MARRKRTPREGVEPAGDWIRRGQTTRPRPSALEEQLLAPNSNVDRATALSAAAAEFAEERARLAEIEQELYRQALKVSALDAHLGALMRLAESDHSADTDVPVSESHMPRRTVDPHPSRASLEREYWLCRCEGFEVDSPTGTVGIVDGVRFGSRVERPDLLEVRAGAFGRRLLLIPVEEVAGIISDEQRIVLGNAPRRGSDRLREQLDHWSSRLRGLPRAPLTARSPEPR